MEKTKSGLTREEVINWISDNELPLKMYALSIDENTLVLHKLKKEPYMTFSKFREFVYKRLSPKRYILKEIVLDSLEDMKKCMDYYSKKEDIDKKTLYRAFLSRFKEFKSRIKLEE